MGPKSQNNKIKIVETTPVGKSGTLRANFMLPTEDYSKIRLLLIHPDEQMYVEDPRTAFSGFEKGRSDLALLGGSFGPLRAEYRGTSSSTHPLIVPKKGKTTITVGGRELTAIKLLVELERDWILNYIGKESPVFQMDIAYGFVTNKAQTSAIRLEMEAVSKKGLRFEPRVNLLDRLDYPLRFEGLADEIKNYTAKTGISYERMDRETTVNAAGDGKSYYHARIVAGKKPIRLKWFYFASDDAKFPRFGTMVAKGHFRCESGDRRRAKVAYTINQPHEKKFDVIFDPPLKNETFDVCFEYSSHKLFCSSAAEAAVHHGVPEDAAYQEIVGRTRELRVSVFLEEDLASRVGIVQGFMGSKLGPKKALKISPIQVKRESLIQKDGDPTKCKGYQLRVSNPTAGVQYGIKWALPT